MSAQAKTSPKNESPVEIRTLSHAVEKTNRRVVVARESESQFPAAAINLRQTISISPPHTGYGATRDEWDHFSLLLGLTGDLLPVVSNPDAKISPNSKMKSLGKTPSVYNRSGHVVGIADWTSKVSTPAEITKWSENPDYGICIATRNVRALDCDITNTILAKDIHDEIDKFLLQALPCRYRNGSPKFLLAFSLPDDYAKRTIKTDHGIIEFLATGQQFVAAGRHPSGERYTWRDGLPEDIPALSPDQFEKLWARLVECFASEPSVEHKPSVKADKIAGAIKNDPVAQSLYDKGAVISAERDGRLHIICPFAAEHTADTGESSTTYFPAFTGGFERGHFHCLHAHCAGRSDGEFLHALGIDSPDLADFDVIPPENDPGQQRKEGKYEITDISNLDKIRSPRWLVKKLLPLDGLGVVFGAPGSGKTFFALDLGLKVGGGDSARWRDREVRGGRVVYIAAEDFIGVAQRARAYLKHHGLDPAGFKGRFGIIADAPNFTRGEDVAAVLEKIQEFGGASLIIVDTWARVTAGSNENSAEDMGKALGYCDALRRATGALVLLVHHSGKDSSKGVRGWSGMQGAADVVLEVTRSNEDREVEVIKLKNAQDGERFGFRLVPVWIAEDEDGEDVTSCVVEHVAASAARVTKRKKLEDKGQRALDAVNAWSVGGKGPTDAELVAAVRNTWTKDEDAPRDLRKQWANRGIKEARDKGYIVFGDDGRWTIKS